VTQAGPVRVLVVGDSYMPTGVFTAALAGLGDLVCVTELQIGSTTAAPSRIDSERALREYVGNPAHLVAAVVGHDALLVHGAPAMIRAVNAIVHESVKPQAAYDQYSTAMHGHNQPEDKR
jgi:hypothetical protein